MKGVYYIKQTLYQIGVL